MKTTIRPATVEDASRLSTTLRAEDRAELLAAGHSDAYFAIRKSLEASITTFAVELGDHLLGLGGVQVGPHNALLDFDVVWFLSAEPVEHNRNAFWKASQWVIRDLLSRFPVLTNRIDARYKRSIRWAQRMGAQIGEASALPGESVPFVQATWRR